MHTLLKNAVVASLLLLAAGCGSRGSVSGKVIYQGKPMAGGTVLFIHEKKGSFASPIKEDGSYQFPDVPGGAMKIAIIGPAATSKWRGPAISDAELEKIQADQPKDQPRISKEAMKEKMGVRTAVPGARGSRLPENYSNPEQSGLTYTVTGGPQTHDITLN